MSENLAQRLAASASAVFVLAAGMVCTGCQQEAHDYVKQQSELSSAKPPAYVAPRSRADRNYEYWANAANEMNVCLDTDKASGLSIGARGHLGKEVVAAIRAQPTKGVAPDLVKEIQATADNLDAMQDVYYAASVESGRLGVAMAGALEDLDGFVESGSGLLSPAGARLVFDAQGAIDIKGVKGVIAASKWVDQTRDQTNAGLAQDRAYFSNRYHVEFPELSLSRNGSYGYCLTHPVDYSY